MKRSTYAGDDHEDSEVIDEVDDSKKEFSVPAAVAGKGIGELYDDECRVCKLGQHK